MYVGETGNLYVETSHPAYECVYDFLVSCCEPESRTERVEQYRLHSASLSAATAEGTYSCAMIREILRHFRLSDALELPIDLGKYRRLAEAATAANFDAATVVKEEGPTRKKVKLEWGALPNQSPPPAEERRPLVSTTVVKPELLLPIPKGIETLLEEEEKSTKLRVVLQPRLRQFHKGTGAKPEKDSDEETLFYFIVSHDRKHMESIVEDVKEFLEPVLLRGYERYIISDIDRNTTTKTEEPEAGRPAAMRRLFDPEYWTAASRHRPSPRDVTASRIVFKCQVKEGKLRNLKDRLYRQLGIRADCVYDYRQDQSTHYENMRLAKHVTLRSYQVESLERFRRGQKAHQGVVVLPCGAGKTLTGIGAACEIQKRTIILTVNNMSVFQWKREFLKWTNLTEDQVTVCTLNQKDLPGPVFITTYSMLIAKRGEAKGVSAQRSEEILEAVGSTAWGLMILDEVHTAPAKNFQEVLNKVKFNCVLGLSATLLREDGKIDDLRHLVGPKLYEANWLQLTNEGFLAKVQCAEVQCPMPPEFAACYYNALEAATRTIRQKSESTKRGRPPTLGYIASNYASCNPYKLWCTQALLSFHQSRSPPDKVIIFCDFLTEVEYYSKHLNIPYMNRNTSETERRNLLDYFQFTDLNAIILTRVGDVALDLPCATVIIQISGLGASRRQEAQRLGRILRPKPPSLDNTCSYFYTLVSKDTKEVQTSYDRQSWLRDQGFAYRVIQAETVLKEYKRIGGMSCCVGPPRWWYQVLREEEEAAGAEPVQAAQPRKLLLKPKSATAPESRIVTYQSSSWRPFSLEASEEIHRAFQLGKPECLLAGEPFFHEPNDCPGSACRVEFSSVDAPRTFGTAMFTSSDNDTGGSEQRTRRITFGRLEGGHVCDGDCLQHAITRLDRLRGNKTRKEVADLSDPDDEDSSGDDYYDSPGDDFF